MADGESSREEDQPDAGSDVSEDRGWQIDTLVVVRHPSLKKQWTPSTKHVGQQTFFKLSRWDRGCTMAFTGKGLELRASKTPNCMSDEGWNQLISGRKAACNAQLHRSLARAAAEAGLPAPQKMRTAREEDCVIAGQVVNLQLNNGVELKCLWGTKQLDSNIWLELTTGCLETLQALMKPCVNEHQAEAAASDVQGKEPGAKVKKRKLRRQGPRSPKKTRRSTALPAPDANGDGAHKSSG